MSRSPQRAARCRSLRSQVKTLRKMVKYRDFHSPRHGRACSGTGSVPEQLCGRQDGLQPEGASAPRNNQGGSFRVTIFAPWERFSLQPERLVRDQEQPHTQDSDCDHCQACSGSADCATKLCLRTSRTHEKTPCNFTVSTSDRPMQFRRKVHHGYCVAAHGFCGKPHARCQAVDACRLLR